MRCNCCARQHQLFALITWLHNLGISYAEIGRRVGLTKSGVHYIVKSYREDE